MRAKLLSGLLGSAGSAALLVSVPANGQTPATAQVPGTGAELPSRDTTAAAAEEAPVNEKDIVVTGSRVARAGYDAPTPTTVVGTELLETRAPATLVDSLARLPAFRNTSTTGTASQVAQGTGGQSFVNLRGLGPNRTLTLFNGQRFVPTTANGTVDISLFPSALVERVEVVTGGASAAYGSDAVAGVVNFILNTKLNGLRANVESGISTYGDGATQKIAGAWGSNLTDRLHVVVGGEYFNGDGVPAGARPFSALVTRDVPNPAYTATNGQPPNLLRNYVYGRTASLNGVIIGGPFNGQQFLPSGTLAPFDLCGATAGSQVPCGSERTDRGNIFYYTQLATQVERKTGYGRVDFQVTPAINLFADYLHGESDTSTTTIPYWSDIHGLLNININNAFLPTAIRSQLAGAGVTTFQLGRFFNDIGPTIIGRKAKIDRFSGGFTADLGGKWKIDGYGSYGDARLKSIIGHQPITQRFINAIDSVLVGNVPTCRINADAVTTNDDPSCIPVNPFGSGNAAGNAYILGDALQRTSSKQTAAALTLSGEPFSTWSGPVSIALGGEYRHEKVGVVSDPLSIARAFRVSNWGPSFAGKVTVKEAFGEIVVPLGIDKPLLEELELNAAGRYTDYSTIGGVATWKVGATYTPIHGIKFRGTRSRDIRAPSIFELFATGSQTSQTVRDPKNGNVQIIIPGFLQLGNPNLTEERADTTAAGVVFEPALIPGFSTSIDYYKIRLQDAIGTLTSQQIITRCADGDASLCGLVQRSNGNGSASGTLVSINVPNLNYQTLTTSGVDFEASYRRAIGPGALSLRVLVNYLDSYRVNDTRNTIERAGDLQIGLAKWNYDLSAAYAWPTTTVLVSGNRIGSGEYTKDPTIAVDAGKIPGVWYFDAALNQKVEVGKLTFTAYANVRNLFNKEPPFGFSILYGNYDRIGRTFVFGVRAQM